MALTRGDDPRTRLLALRSGSPSAIARLSDDGAVRLTWLNDAMGELLDPAHEGHPTELAEVLHRESAARLGAVVRDLVRMDGGSASVAVTVQRGWPRQVWVRLQVRRPGRWATAFGRRPDRRAAVHVELPVRGGVPGGGAGGRAELAEGLRHALQRRRRWSSRITVAMVTAIREEVDGPQPVPLPATAELAERVRHAARGTDTVVVLTAGRIAVLAENVAENVAEDGEALLARRVLAVLDRAAGEGSPLVTGVAVLEVVDVEADPDAVIDVLLRSEVRHTGAVTVLPPWTADREPDRDEEDELPPAAFHRRVQAALASGRFVPGAHLLTATNRTDGTARTLTVIEACTVEDDQLTPVQVDAPGLAAALDRWLAKEVQAIGAHRGDRSDWVVLLQPGGELGPWLAAGVSAPNGSANGARRGGRPVVAIPEGRLLAALSAERAVLREMALRDVPLAVADWTGRIDVPTLVRSGIGMVLLAAETQRAVLRPDGAALLAGLVAGLRAGLGDSALVLAVDAEENSVTTELEACGIVCAATSPTVMMVRP